MNESQPISASFEDLVIRVDNAFPVVSSGSDDPMIDGLQALREIEDYVAGLSGQLDALRNGLEVIATTTYPARYLGTDLRGIKLYGGTDDASRFAREVLDSLEGNQ